MENIAGTPLTESDNKNTINASNLGWMFFSFGSMAFSSIAMVVVPILYVIKGGVWPKWGEYAIAFWAIGVALANLASAVIMPVIAQLCDDLGVWRLVGALSGICGSTALALIGIYGNGNMVIVQVLFVIGCIASNVSETNGNAFLPNLSKDYERDSLSAKGFAARYLGGLITLSMAWLFMRMTGDIGTVVKYSTVLTAALWFVSTIIFILSIRVQAAESEDYKQQKFGLTIASSYRQMWELLSGNSNGSPFLWSYLIWGAGVFTFVNLSAAYSTQIGCDPSSVVESLLLMLIVGLPFTMLFGELTSLSNGKQRFAIALVVVIVTGLSLLVVFNNDVSEQILKPAGYVYMFAMTFAIVAYIGIIAVFAKTYQQPLQSKDVLFFALLCYIIVGASAALIDSTLDLYLIAASVGILQGGTLALGRSIFTKIIGLDKITQFFAGYRIVGIMATALGTLMFSSVLWICNSMRMGVFTVSFLFLVGALISRISISRINWKNRMPAVRN